MVSQISLADSIPVQVVVSYLSHISNACLIDCHNAFPGDAFRTDKNSTIFDYAKKMGYKTINIDIDNGYFFTLVIRAGKV